MIINQGFNFVIVYPADNKRAPYSGLDYDIFRNRVLFFYFFESIFTRLNLNFVVLKI